MVEGKPRVSEMLSESPPGCTRLPCCRALWLTHLLWVVHPQRITMTGSLKSPRIGPAALTPLLPGETCLQCLQVGLCG